MYPGKPGFRSVGCEFCALGPSCLEPRRRLPPVSPPRRDLGKRQALDIRYPGARSRVADREAQNGLLIREPVRSPEWDPIGLGVSVRVTRPIM